MKSNLRKQISIITAVLFLILASCSLKRIYKETSCPASSFCNVEIVKNYDGDTITINIPGQNPVFGKNLGVRINGIDTPEIRGKSACEKATAKKAKNRLKNILEKSKNIEFKNVKRGKYFRIVADVYTDGKNVSEILIKEGLAVSYDGGTKKKGVWDCK